jgi:hypothetical protein
MGGCARLEAVQPIPFDPCRLLDAPHYHTSHLLIQRTCHQSRPGQALDGTVEMRTLGKEIVSGTGPKLKARQGLPSLASMQCGK